MQVILGLVGVLVLLSIVFAAIDSRDSEVSPTEEAADEIMDELLQAEAPAPPPADLFLNEEDCQPKVEEVPEPATPIEEVVVAPEPVKEAAKEPVKKKRKHYPSKPKNKKA